MYSWCGLLCWASRLLTSTTLSYDNALMQTAQNCLEDLMEATSLPDCSESNEGNDIRAAILIEWALQKTWPTASVSSIPHEQRCPPPKGISWFLHIECCFNFTRKPVGFKHFKKPPRSFIWDKKLKFSCCSLMQKKKVIFVWFVISVSIELNVKILTTY